MARFVLVGSVAGAPPGGQYSSFGTGTKIASDAQSAHQGDIIWPALAAAPSPSMAALDQAALDIILRFVPSIDNHYVTTIQQG